MEYSALVFDDCKEVEDTYDKLLETIDLFAQDENCTQIVVSCKSVWTLRLASSPKNKVMLVQRPDKPYVALLNGLKARIEKGDNYSEGLLKEAESLKLKYTVKEGE